MAKTVAKVVLESVSRSGGSLGSEFTFTIKPRAAPQVVVNKIVPEDKTSNVGKAVYVEEIDTNQLPFRVKLDIDIIEHDRSPATGKGQDDMGSTSGEVVVVGPDKKSFTILGTIVEMGGVHDGESANLAFAFATSTGQGPRCEACKDLRALAEQTAAELPDAAARFVALVRTGGAAATYSPLRDAIVNALAALDLARKGWRAKAAAFVKCNGGTTPRDVKTIGSADDLIYELAAGNVTTNLETMLARVIDYQGQILNEHEVDVAIEALQARKTAGCEQDPEVVVRELEVAMRQKSDARAASRARAKELRSARSDAKADIRRMDAALTRRLTAADRLASKVGTGNCDPELRALVAQNPVVDLAIANLLLALRDPKRGALRTIDDIDDACGTEDLQLSQFTRKVRSAYADWTKCLKLTP